MQGSGHPQAENSPEPASGPCTTRRTIGYSDSRAGSAASSVSELLGSYADEGPPWLPSPTAAAAGGAAGGGGGGEGVVDRRDLAHYDVRPAGLLERQDSAHEVSSNVTANTVETCEPYA